MEDVQQGLSRPLLSGMTELSSLVLTIPEPLNFAPQDRYG